MSMFDLTYPCQLNIPHAMIALPFLSCRDREPWLRVEDTSKSPRSRATLIPVARYSAPRSGLSWAFHQTSMRIEVGTTSRPPRASSSASSFQIRSVSS